MIALVLVAVVLGGSAAVSAMYTAHAMDLGTHSFQMTADVFVVGGLIGGAAALAGGLGYLIAHAVGARHLVLVAFAVGVPGGLVTGALARDSAGSGFGYQFAIAGFVVGAATFTGLVLARRALRRGPAVDVDAESTAGLAAGLAAEERPQPLP